MSDIVRTRRKTAREKAVVWTVRDGSGAIEDISALNVATAFVASLRELDSSEQVVGAPFTGGGSFAFVTDGTDGQIAYTLTVAEAGNFDFLEALLTVTFLTGRTEIYPTPNRYILKFRDTF